MSPTLKDNADNRTQVDEDNGSASADLPILPRRPRSADGPTDRRGMHRARPTRPTPSTTPGNRSQALTAGPFAFDPTGVSRISKYLADSRAELRTINGFGLVAAMPYAR